MAPTRKQSLNCTNQCKDDLYWSKIHRTSLFPNIIFSRDKRTRLEERKKRREEQRQSFRSTFQLTAKQDSSSSLSHTNIIKCLKYWIKYESWSFCQHCFLLAKNSLTPKSFTSRGCKFISKCVCKDRKYPIPSLSSIPPELAELTKDEERILSLFYIDVGKYKKMRHGSRVKTCVFSLEYRPDTVQQRISKVTDPVSKNRLQTAFSYLISSSLSSYSTYLQHQKKPPNKKKIKYWEIFASLDAIECALWPKLYPFSSWCESVMSRKSKQSVIRSFRLKLFSTIVDYGMNFELLQLQYDRWLYNTINAAVICGRRMKTSPARALEEKPFSPDYWRWQNRFLEDAVRQFGYPSFFITISPYEWDFPFPIWFQKDMGNYDILPTEGGAMETLHIAHILDQLCRGYISGSNCNLWDSHQFRHIFNNGAPDSYNNVSCVFYRFEFQNRRTVHLHMLVWIKNVSNIDTDVFSATIPDDDEEKAFDVHRLQPSDQTPSCLKISD